MDSIDRHTLKALQQDGRKKNSELAKEVGLAPSTMLDRVKKLEDRGIVKGYRAVMDPEKLGLKAQGFACISLNRHQVKDIELLENEIKKISCVRACYHITGRFDYLLHVVAPEEKKDLKTRIKQNFPQKRYIPKMTANMFARMCVEDKDIPEEENDPSWGKCPLLVDDMCSIYDVRPFGCRALMSQVHCREKGYARIPPIVLTINNLFLQYIEHLDQKGFFGNLSDMLTLFLSDNTIQSFSDPSKITNDGRFLFNEKIAVLMIPPEHREKLRPLLMKLSDLL